LAFIAAISAVIIFKAADRGFLLGGQWARRPEMRKQNEQRVLNAAELLPDLAADRIEKPGPRIDRLRDIAR
jgi:hypothetical protein